MTTHLEEIYESVTVRELGYTGLDYPVIVVGVSDHPFFYDKPAHYQLIVEQALEDLGYDLIEQVGEWLFNPNTTRQITHFKVQ